MEKLFATLRDEDNLKGLTRLNLQFFADDGGEGGEGEDKGNDGDNQNKEPNNDPNKTYTQEELDKLIQSEADKRVSSALETARTKWEKEYQEKLEREKKEAERLANLSAEEKEKELLEKTKRDIEERERTIKLKELKLDAIDILVEKKLPVKFADMLLKDDAESTMDNIKLFEKEWQEAIDAAVTEKLKGKSPKLGIEDGGNDISSIASERNKEYKPELNPWG